MKKLLLLWLLVSAQLSAPVATVVMVTTTTSALVALSDQAHAQFTVRPTAGQFTPSLNLDFTKGTLPVGSIFTRSSTATYTNSSGYLATASANVARFNYNQNGTIRGLVIEASSMNRFINSSNISATTGHTQSNVTYTSGALGPDNTLSSYTMTGGTGFCAVSNSATFSYSTASAYTVFWIVKPGSTSSVTISIDSGPAVNYTLSGVGSYTASSSINLSAAYISPLANGFYSCQLTATSKPFQKNIWYIIGAGSSVIVYGIQEEDGNGSSYIPTGASAVTRQADAWSCSFAGSNVNEGTVFVEAMGFTVLRASPGGGGSVFSPFSYNRIELPTTTGNLQALNTNTALGMPASGYVRGIMSWQNPGTGTTRLYHYYNNTQLINQTTTQTLIPVTGFYFQPSTDGGTEIRKIMMWSKILPLTYQKSLTN